MPSRHTPPRILITRSRHQASVLSEQLQAIGVEPILIPTISIAPPHTYAPLDGAIAELHSFDWLLFTSANAVEAFALRGSAHRFAARPGDLPRIAAIGPSTSKALARIGLTPDLLPPQSVAESLAQSLLPHVTPGVTRFLLVRAESARDTLPQALRAAGAQLTIAPAYRNIIPEESIPLLQTLFATPASRPDAITFTSSSTAANLFALLEAAEITLKADQDDGNSVLRASIGPITSQTLRDLGYPPHLEASEPTIHSLVAALTTALRLQPR